MKINSLFPSTTIQSWGKWSNFGDSCIVFQPQAMLSSSSSSSSCHCQLKNNLENSQVCQIGNKIESLASENVLHSKVVSKKKKKGKLERNCVNYFITIARDESKQVRWGLQGECHTGLSLSSTWTFNIWWIQNKTCWPELISTYMWQLRSLNAESNETYKKVSWQHMFRDDSHKNYEEEKTVVGITWWMDEWCVCARTCASQLVNSLSLEESFFEKTMHKHSITWWSVINRNC